MCDPTDYKQSVKARAVDASRELADIVSRHLDKPVSRDAVYSLIQGDWDRIAKLAHEIHGADRRERERRRP